MSTIVSSQITGKEAQTNHVYPIIRSSVRSEEGTQRVGFLGPPAFRQDDLHHPIRVRDSEPRKGGDAQTDPKS